MLNQASHQMKKVLLDLERNQQQPSKVREHDSFSVVVARALLLFLLTFDLFLNAYVLMSLDRYNLLVGIFTIVACAVGQFSAITGQFGYQIGDTLLNIFVILDIILLLFSSLIGQFSQNFMTQLSFIFSLFGLIVACFIVVKRKQTQLLLN